MFYLCQRKDYLPHSHTYRQTQISTQTHTHTQTNTHRQTRKQTHTERETHVFLSAHGGRRWLTVNA